MFLKEVDVRYEWETNIEVNPDAGRRIVHTTCPEVSPVHSNDK